MKLWGSVLVAVVGLTACQSENPNNCGWIGGAYAQDVRRVDGGWRFTTSDTIVESVDDFPITGDVWLSSIEGIVWGKEYCERP